MRRAAQTAGATGNWSRRYPPVALLAAALALAALALPSSLILPQASPSQTLEYAPVPPNGSAPPGGNFAGLGLGESATLGETGLPPLSTPPGGGGEPPSQKQCVGTPPRQAEDPLAPPCVPFFAGDNGGSTHQGVTRGEVRVLYYFDSGDAAGTSNSDDKHPPDSYWDLASSPAAGEPVFVRLLRDLQRYFNARYQTYGRFVHIWVHFGSVYPANQVSRAADAAEDYQKLHPYAVVAAVDPFLNDYVHPMAVHGVTVFLGNPAAGVFGSGMQSASYYSSAPGLIWSYFPSVEQLARDFVSYVCQKVVPYPVSFAGDPTLRGGKRKLGLWQSGDAAVPDLVRFGSLVRQGVVQCGGDVADVESAPVNNGTDANGNSTNCTSETSAWAQFKQQRVTTVIWTAGYTEQCELTFAQAVDYLPELVIAGDGLADTDLAAQTQGPSSEMADARTVSTYTAVARVADEPCYQALVSVDPTLAVLDAKGYGCAFYPDVRELFTGIQVAGPRLDPQQVDQGFHAIPAVSSSDPRVPACFYSADDYTCVKDAQAEWWDPSGHADTEPNDGCWRMMQGGRRYLAATWPAGDVEAQHGPSDPCNYNGLAAA